MANEEISNSFFLPAEWGYDLLIPGNKKYEPIQLKTDQVYINGIVIGILKKV